MLRSNKEETANTYTCSDEVFWVLTLHNLIGGYKRFWRTYCLHLQGQELGQTRHLPQSSVFEKKNDSSKIKNLYIFPSSHSYSKSFPVSSFSIWLYCTYTKQQANYRNHIFRFCTNNFLYPKIIRNIKLAWNFHVKVKKGKVALVYN